MATDTGHYNSDSDSFYLPRNPQPSIDRSNEDLSDSKALIPLDFDLKPRFKLPHFRASPDTSEEELFVSPHRP